MPNRWVAYVLRRWATDDHRLRVSWVRLAPVGHERSQILCELRTYGARGSRMAAGPVGIAYVWRLWVTNERSAGGRQVRSTPPGHECRRGRISTNLKEPDVAIRFSEFGLVSSNGGFQLFRGNRSNQTSPLGEEPRIEWRVLAVSPGRTTAGQVELRRLAPAGHKRPPAARELGASCARGPQTIADPV